MFATHIQRTHHTGIRLSTQRQTALPNGTAGRVLVVRRVRVKLCRGEAMNRYLLAIWVMLAAVVAAGQTSAPKHQALPPPSSMDQQELTALSLDIERMRSLVRQMEMNLALVQTTTTPLKHQFELQTEAWQVLLNGMERRLLRLKSNNDGVVSPATVPLRRDPSQGTP